MTELDHTQQRIIGVLIEKELAVPESYPLTENALIAACNQKSNRDPEMGLEQFEVHGAMVALMTAEWAKTMTGSRTTRYAHRLDTQFAVNLKEKAVLCELLIRGPQAPSSLKQRVARLGFHGSPAEIEATLQAMASKVVPMAERLAKRPRERDCRWRHLLGAMDSSHLVEAGDDVVPTQQGTTPAEAAATPISVPTDLEQRVAQLETAVEDLRAELRELK